MRSKTLWPLGAAFLILLLAGCGGQTGKTPDSTLSAASVGPRVVTYPDWQSGDAVFECTQAGVNFDGAYKVDPPESGPYHLDTYGNKVTVTFYDGGRYMDWSATLPISAVIVKGAPGPTSTSMNPRPPRAWACGPRTTPVLARFPPSAT